MPTIVIKTKKKRSRLQHFKIQEINKEKLQKKKNKKKLPRSARFNSRYLKVTLKEKENSQ